MAVPEQARRRLIDLVHTHDDRPELHGRPLLDEMDDLGGIAAAGELARSGSVDDRFVAARLMHLLPDEAHVEPLAALVHDPDPRVASAARRALHGQRRSAAWRALVQRLADDSSKPELAATASGWLEEGIPR
jgi:HEAT repeat protein